MSRLLVLATLLLIAGVLAPSTAAAFNSPVAQDGDLHLLLGAVPDGEGGAIVVWTSGWGSRDLLTAVHAQRFNRGGKALWGEQDLRIPTPGNDDWHHIAWVFGDGQGGVLVVWQDLDNYQWPIPAITTLRAQRVSPAGHAVWDTLGVPLCTAPQTRYNVKFVADGIGGGLFAWMDHRNGFPNDTRGSFEDYFRQWGSGFDVFAQRVDSAGNTYSGPSGIAIRDTVSFGDLMDYDFPEWAPSMDMIPDGTGGALLAWPDHRSLHTYGRDIFAQRVDLSGHALWAKNGVPVYADSFRSQAAPRLAADGQGGAIVVWQDQRGYALCSLYAQKLDASGRRLWDPAGVRLSPDTSVNRSPSIVSDGSGGAVVAWAGRRTESHVYAQRLSAAGIPQWALPGVSIASYFHEDSWWGDGGVPLIPDGQGGARTVVATLQSGDEYGSPVFRLHAQRLSGSGDTRWGSQGIPLPPWPSLPYPRPILVPSGNGMFVFWSGRSIYGAYVGANGFESLTDVSTPQPEWVASIAPNPLRTSAQLSISLDRPGRVRATVVDLQGRAVRHLIDRDEAAGSRQIAFDGKDDAGAALRSGVYFLRVSTPSSTTTKAFVIAR